MSPLTEALFAAGGIALGFTAVVFLGRALDAWLDQHPGIDLDDLDRPRTDRTTP